MRISYLLFLTFFVASLYTDAKPILQDSVGVEEIDGKRYIIHKVTDNETLYSLSRRYNVPIYQIIENNPPTEFGLEIGSLVKIPILEKPKEKPAPEVIPTKSNPSVTTVVTEFYHEVKAKETLFSISREYGVEFEDIKTWNNLTDNNIAIGQQLLIKRLTKSTERNTEKTALSGSKHTVEPSETLYSLSKKYNTTIENLMKWNDLVSDEISIGQELIVEVDSVSLKERKAVKDEGNEKRKITMEKDTAEQYRPIKNPTVNVSESGFEEIIESGLAALIEGSEDTRKYLALHRTAKVGTIMRVTNEMNGQEVFVRVLGKLPDTGVNKNIVIRISKSAYNRLGAIDPKFRVKVSYLP